MWTYFEGVGSVRLSGFAILALGGRVKLVFALPNSCRGSRIGGDAARAIAQS